MKTLILCIALLFSAVQTHAHQLPKPPAPPQMDATTKAAYYCNALAKATGKPCRHRVKHQGDRCWQHREAK